MYTCGRLVAAACFGDDFNLWSDAGAGFDIGGVLLVAKDSVVWAARVDEAFYEGISW